MFKFLTLFFEQIFHIIEFCHFLTKKSNAVLLICQKQHRRKTGRFSTPQNGCAEEKTNILRVENNVGFEAEFCKVACMNSSP